MYQSIPSMPPVGGPPVGGPPVGGPPVGGPPVGAASVPGSIPAMPVMSLVQINGCYYWSVGGKLWDGSNWVG